MSDVYLDHDTKEESLAAQLPEFMPKDPESGNYRFLSTIAERLESLENDIESIDRATSIQYADTIDQLEQLAELVNLQPYQNETTEHFRARVFAEFQLITSKGTVSDLLNATATILGVEIEDIRYTEEYTTAAGSARLNVPFSKLDQIPLSESEFGEIVSELVPSSYRVDVLKVGTFTFVSPETYNDGTFVHDPDLGYDGLDTNGDPKGNGGTYAGVL
ncbi:P2 gpI-like phage tail protein [Halorubrum tailed virus 25]|uniref:P2 gpI-like phage tail protein n=1 Tax=Halorubrum tailed virus 25 TaxID=2878006 RepID=A0AAE9BY81_9CAUD|nr:baseplate protein [Halorubrum tailed virus 25]UBF22614.1 P2 gpI-like phage tail protein [Halorubrum tailed virus 25]